MLDLSKAGNMVSFSILCRKFNYGVKAWELEWFVSNLSGKKLIVCVGMIQSAWSDIWRGVPQGSIWGPLQFIFYVNNLAHVVMKFRVKQYADNTALYCINDSSIES